MAKKKKDLSAHSEIPSGKGKRIGIVVSDWNEDITSAMAKAAVSTLQQAGVKSTNIFLTHVPGSFELPLGAQRLARQKKIDAVICIGCVIRGETRHFEFICSACANGITAIGLKYNKPVIFGVLTTESYSQARARAGGKHGNKGVEAAVTALQMLS